MLLGVCDTNQNSDRQYTTASEIQKLQMPAMPNSTKIWRTQPPDCHIHVSLLVWIPGPLLSQLSGQKVPAPHGTSSFAPEWRSEENYNKSCAHFLLMPSRPSVPPSQPPVKHQRRVIQASCGISGSWDGAVGRESKTPTVTVTVRTSLGGRDLLGHPSTWDLRIVKKNQAKPSSSPLLQPTL